MTRGYPLGKQLRSGPARGVPVYGGKRQVVVKMDRDQFDFIYRRALRENTSVAEQIRNLIEWGIETTGEDDEQWPTPTHL